MTNTLLENAYRHNPSPKYQAFIRTTASNKVKEGLTFHERQAVDVIIKQSKGKKKETVDANDESTDLRGMRVQRLREYSEVFGITDSASKELDSCIHSKEFTLEGKLNDKIEILQK